QLLGAGIGGGHVAYALAQVVDRHRVTDDVGYFLNDLADLRPTFAANIEVIEAWEAKDAGMGAGEVLDIDEIADDLPLPVERNGLTEESGADDVRDGMGLGLAELVGAERVEVTQDRRVEAVKLVVSL